MVAKGLSGGWDWYLWPGRQQRASVLVLHWHKMDTTYTVSFWFSFSGGSLSRLLSHLFRVNSSQYLEDSDSKVGPPDISSHLSLAAQGLWGSLWQESRLLCPPFGIPVLIAPVIPGNKNMDH